MSEIKVLIVDASVVLRRLLTNVLDGDAALEVVGTAPNGKIALAKISQVKPDLIVLDVEMPEMEGWETLAAIQKQHNHIPIIIFTALTELVAVTNLNGMGLGAAHYVAKPQNMKANEEALEYIHNLLIPKIKAFLNGNRSLKLDIKSSENNDILTAQLPNKSHFIASNLAVNIRSQVEIVVIGASTGGPNALETVLHGLPANFPVPIVIVQHMPPVFTKRLADRLTQKCKIRVEEAVTGVIVEPGVAWIAPGDYHIVLEKQGFGVRIRTHQEARENSCRPAVDVLFRSTAKIYGAGVLGVVLTGMGQDGLLGCQNIGEAGGKIIVQDEASSVVWGMPGSVVNSGFADRVVSLQDMAREIIDRVISH
jgi:two-component system, chemotaxis family, protein-glutamate methylesterase/glutaminase